MTESLSLTLPVCSHADDATSPDRCGNTREDTELALDEGEQAKEAKVPLEFLLIAQLLEVLIVVDADDDLSTFYIVFFGGYCLLVGFVYQSRHVLGDGPVAIRQGDKGCTRWLNVDC